jgi:hypothetical protein
MATDGAVVAAKDADVVAGAMALRRFSRAQMQSRRLNRWRGRDRTDAEMAKAVAVAAIAVVVGSSLQAMGCRRATPPRRPPHRARHRNREHRVPILRGQAAKRGMLRQTKLRVATFMKTLSFMNMTGAFSTLSVGPEYGSVNAGSAHCPSTGEHK